MKIVVKMVPLPAMLGVAENPWMAFAIMADATEVTPRRIGEEDVSAKIDSLALAQRRRPERASLVKSIAASIVTRTSTSLGIALAVRMEPRSEIRCTPGQARAASTKARTASSSGRRGSATEGEGARGWLRRFLFEAGLRSRAVSLFIP